jgi:hypothetical protein
MRKGQAALEFLTTYGWAFLVILVMIGALAYFGVLNPSKLLPPKCIFAPEIGCTEFQLFTNGSLYFKFKNNVGESATFQFIATALVGTNPQVNCAATGSSASLTTLGAGRTAEVHCYFNDSAAISLASGDRPKFDMLASYVKSSGTYNTTARGEIQAEAK